MKTGKLASALLIVMLMSFIPGALAFDFSQIEDKIVEHTLDNGLTFLILPRHEAPVISFVTQANVGCADDPKGYMGLAHMFEHMAFKGTKEIGTTDFEKEKKWIAEEDRIFEMILDERARGDLADSARLAELETQMQEATDSASQYVVTNEFNQILNREGGVGLNAGTSQDQTSYYISLPSNKLELWMAMESDRFANPILRDLYKEKQVVAEERRFRVESSPTGRMFYQEYVGLAFNSHPYGQPIIGEMNEIQNYNRPIMRDQFNKYYIPRNLVIAIVGDVEPDEVIKLADKYFGRIKDRPKLRPLDVRDPAPYGVRTTTIYDEAQPMFISGYFIPSANHPDFIAVSALANYLGSGRTSVFNKKLVKEDKSAIEASAWAGFPGRKYHTLFNIICIPSNESTNAENEAKILAEIENVRTDLIPVEELDKIKAQAKAGMINAMGSNMGLASQLTAYQTRTGNWRDLFDYLNKVNALTREDIKRVAETYLDPQKRVVVYIEKPEA